MISIKNITKSYSNGVISLSNVSLEIPKGSVLGLIGTNGAGKSTLLRILSGILKEDSGEIKIDGESVFENSFTKSKTSFISDEGYLIPSFTLESMADLYASMNEKFSYEIFNSLCNTMHLDPKRKINTYSKGMKRQGEVILALSSGTDYLFFDETFDGLDPIARENARRMIAQCVSDNNTTVIMSSHNLSEIENICDSIALLDDGVLIFKKSVEQALNNTKKYQAVFDEEINLDTLPKSFFKLKASGKLITFISDLEEKEVEELLSVQGRKLIYLESVILTLEEIFSIEVERAREGGLIND